MRWNVGTKIGAGFALTLIIFVIVGLVAHRSTTQLIETSTLTRHTYEVITKLTELLSTVKDIEAAQRGYVITGDSDFLQQFDGAQRALDRQIDEVRELTRDNPSQQQRVTQLEPQLRSRVAASSQTIEARRTQGLDAATAIIRTGVGRAASDASVALVAEMTREERQLLETRTAATESDARTAEATLIYGVLAAIVLAGFLGILITRNIAGPLASLTRAADLIRQGELNAEIETEPRNDEVGALMRSFQRMAHSLRGMANVAEQIAAGDLRANLQPQSPNDVLGNAFARMIDNLREQIRSMGESAAALGSAASEIVASTSQLASGASESAAAVAQTTTTVEEVRQTAHLASQKAKAVSDSALRAVQIAENGRTATVEVVSGMSRIRQQMDAIGESMMRLSEQSHTIGQIIATVEDLSAQSNLLAVNAAIEAAKAGEAGKGFSVVAQEVKSLAEQSRQATDRVRGILNDIQKATTAAVLAAEQGNKAVEAGDRQTGTADGSIQTLAGTVTEAAQAATQIAASSQQQLVGMDQVALAMDSIKQASTQNVASAKQLEVAARSLNDLGQRLKHLVERYAV